MALRRTPVAVISTRTVAPCIMPLLIPTRSASSHGGTTTLYSFLINMLGVGIPSRSHSCIQGMNKRYNIRNSAVGSINLNEQTKQSFHYNPVSFSTSSFKCVAVAVMVMVVAVIGPVARDETVPPIDFAWAASGSSTVSLYANRDLLRIHHPYFYSKGHSSLSSAVSEEDAKTHPKQHGNRHAHEGQECKKTHRPRVPERREH